MIQNVQRDQMNLSQEQLGEMSDEQVFQLCRRYGSSALYWRQKFTGLLPEVNRRRLYEKKGFASIFEFAKKLAGLSEEQVRITLNIEKRFEDKPTLHGLLVNGEVSINKLARVVSIATAENQAELAEQVKLLPQKALETFVRDEKWARQQKSENQNDLPKPLFEDKSLRAQMQEPQLAEDVKQELFVLQEKGIDINEMLREFLRQSKLEIVQEKEKIAAELLISSGHKKVSRYIPVNVKTVIAKEFGTQCSIETCKKAAQNLHHTRRFALTKSHNPHYLAPLCKEHHTIAHSIDLKFHKARDRNH